MESAKWLIEAATRIEPARLADAPEAIANLIAELSTASARLGARLHPTTAANLAGAVRLMNCYYSNLIEGHNTRPRDIEKAMAGEFDASEDRRNLQLEALAHIRIQESIDLMAAENRLPEPASEDFIRRLHREFYKDAPLSLRTISSEHSTFVMEPGEWRSAPGHDVAVGRHIPPSSERVGDFMAHFASRYRFEGLGAGARIMTIAAAHHRFNYIHPFPDGNGRVSRLMSHAMALKAGIGAHGLWSVSRGLARGLDSRTDYKRMMDHADSPRQGDLDGRGNLSERALKEFTAWFLAVCLDQVRFMSDLFDLESLGERLRRYVDRESGLKPEAARLLTEALLRGQIVRGDASRAAGLPERTSRRLLNDLVARGLLASETAKGPVSLRFPIDALDLLFPRLYSES